MPNGLTKPIAALMIGASLAGCAADEREPAADASPAARVAMVPDLAIGMLDGPDPYMFGRASGVTMDDDGRIFVADAQADEVRAFSTNGDYLFTVGRRGAGPGELSGPCCPAFGPDGLLWVRDGGNARYNRYAVSDSSAEYVGLSRMAHGDVNFHAPITFDSAGRLIDIGHQGDPATGEMQTVRFQLDSAGTVVHRQPLPAPPGDSIGLHRVTREAGDSRSTFYLWQPHGPMELIAHSPTGDWARAINSRYAVNWHSADGSLLHGIGREADPGPQLSAAERETAEERMSFYVAQFGVARGDIPFVVPDRKQPLRGLMFDQSGRLWIELSVPDNQPRRAHVYDREGTHSMTVEWPDNVVLSWFIADDVALGTSTDSLGVQQVVRLRQ
jgi:hypothetical protein